MTTHEEKAQKEASPQSVQTLKLADKDFKIAMVHTSKKIRNNVSKRVKGKFFNRKLKSLEKKNQISKLRKFKNSPERFNNRSDTAEHKKNEFKDKSTKNM